MIFRCFDASFDMVVRLNDYVFFFVLKELLLMDGFVILHT